jgi:hypothetical protein
MGIILFAIIGAGIAYFGGTAFDVYEGYGATAPYIGALIGAVAAGVIGLALRPRRGPAYRGPELN